MRGGGAHGAGVGTDPDSDELQNGRHVRTKTATAQDLPGAARSTGDNDNTHARPVCTRTMAAARNVPLTVS